MAFDRQKLLESAQRFIRKGQIRRAIGDYEKLVADDPRNIRIRSKLADLYVRNNRIDQAAEAYIQLAKQYETEDLNYRAISMYKKVLTIRPKRIDVHHWLADLYRKEGLFGNAKVLYQNIIKLNPEDEVARRTMTEIGHAMAGTGAVRRQNEISPLDQLEYGISSNDQPGMDEPSTDEEVLEIDVPDPKEISETEEILDLEEPLEPPIESQEPVEANQSARDNLQLTHQQVNVVQNISPEKDLESHYHLGIAYLEMDLVDEAIPEFEAALAYDPKKVDCLVMLGRCYMEKGAFDRSISYLEKALQMEGLTDEEYTRIKRELGRVHENAGHKGEG